MAVENCIATRRTRLLLILVLGVIATLMMLQNGLAATDKTSLDAVQLASASLQEHCNRNLARLSGDADSAETAQAVGLSVKCSDTVRVLGTTYRVIVVGCTGEGELVLVKRTDQTKVQCRLVFNIPANHVAFGTPIDVNADGILELPIYESSGSHGSYLILVSMYGDSLVSITDSSGHYQFFASGGGMELKDIDGDRMFEIVLEEMLWPSDSLRTEPRKRVYRLVNNRYLLSEVR